MPMVDCNYSDISLIFGKISDNFLECDIYVITLL